MRNCKDNSMADARSVQNAAQTFRADRAYCSMNVLKIENKGAAGTAVLVQDLFIRFRSTLGFDHAFKVFTLVQDFVDQTKLLCLLGGHEVIAIERALDHLIGLAGVFHINLV